MVAYVDTISYEDMFECYENVTHMGLDRSPMPVNLQWVSAKLFAEFYSVSTRTFTRGCGLVKKLCEGILTKPTS